MLVRAFVQFVATKTTRASRRSASFPQRSCGLPRIGVERVRPVQCCWLSFEVDAPSTPLNLCRACSQDFAGVEAFDRHRVGEHAFLYSEGLKLDPPREDGRRCLSSEEMLAMGMEVDPRGRWRIIPSAAQQTFFTLRQRTSSGQDSPPQSASEAKEVSGAGVSRRKHSAAPAGVES